MTDPSGLVHCHVSACATDPAPNRIQQPTTTRTIEFPRPLRERAGVRGTLTVRLFAASPIHWPTFQIHHGKDPYCIGFDGIQERIRKTGKQSAPHRPNDDRARFRMLKDGLGTAFNLIKEG